ncbi:MAG TPA: acetoacetate--CoA ligase [Mycobacteriales bacterium]|nr:acetoacetate--CoA ligase [Mycobacteriales bacterium]
MTAASQTATVLWEPSPERVAAARLTAFAAYASERHGAPADPTYEQLWAWSVEHLPEFWAAAWEYFDVVASAPYDRVVTTLEMPGARWFPGARLNLAENVLRADRPGPALVATTEQGPVREVSWPELRGLVGAFARTLRGLGVTAGDRVVAYLPNGVEAVVAMLGCAAVGAVWSTCAPDIGAASAVDRFGQLDPTVLLAVDGYAFAGKERDRRDAVAALLDGLPTVEAVVCVPLLGHGVSRPGLRVLTWDEAVADPCDPTYAQLDAEAPLWVVYSSGTTGLPKGLVHGHAGVLLMGLVQQALQYDIGEGDRAFWYTTTSWIMWNSQIAALTAGATAVLYDGSPLWPTPDRLWQLAEEHRVTSLGTSPGYLLACEKAGLQPGREHDLSALRAVGVTGSPLPASSFRWVYEQVGGDLALHVISGGTDFCAALVCDAPWLPVTEGEMSCRGLGIAAASWDEQGRPVVDDVGELVVTAPMPSMPLGIWGDDDGSRYADAYFDVYPGVWRHGDWMTLTSRGTAVVHGRSDSTLNRHGVRMGSADIYAAVESVPEVAEALVLGVEQPDGGYWLPLFVRLVPGVELDDELVARLKSVVREQASPRHVPDEVIAVPAVPHTSTGKKLEIPLKRIAQGVAVEKALNLGSVDDPEAVRWFVELLARPR